MIDKILGIVAAILTPVMTLLIHHHAISSNDATDIGAIFAGLVVGFHGSTIFQTTRSRNASRRSASAARDSGDAGSITKTNPPA